MTKEVIDLGDDHTLTFASYKDEPHAGANVAHKKPDGTTCDSFIAFAGRSWAQAFNGNITTCDVLQDEPLTLSPSLLCRACGDHGFIREGKWVRA